MLIGILDVFIFSGILFFNTYFWKLKPLKTSEWLLLSFSCLILFSFILPFISALAERHFFKMFLKNESTDGFEGLYIFLRWPTYWFSGFLELLYLLLITFGFRKEIGPPKEELSS